MAVIYAPSDLFMQSSGVSNHLVDIFERLPPPEAIVCVKPIIL